MNANASSRLSQCFISGIKYCNESIPPLSAHGQRVEMDAVQPEHQSTE